MAGIPYAGWFAYIRKFLERRKPALELFSGPAELARLARTEGFTVFALDSYFPFLKNNAGAGINADARALPFADASLGTLIAANCGLNYLNGPDELQAHFRECRRVLSPGGFYIVDICPEERAIGLGNTTQTALAGRIRFAHRYQSAARNLETTVTISDGFETTEVHRQHIFTAGTMTDAAEAAGFSVAERTENYALPAPGTLKPIEVWVLSAGSG